MFRRSAPLWTLACLALLAPVAAAHGTAHDSALWLGDERVLVTISGAPIPVEGVPLTLLVKLPMREAGDEPAVQATLIAPSGAVNGSRTMGFQNGTHSLAAKFTEPGMWRVLIEAEGRSVEDAVHVHPEGEVFVTAADSLATRSVLVAGEPEKVSLRVATVHGMEVPEARDAVARVETWDAEGTTLLNIEEVPAIPRNATVYEFVRTWSEPGLVRITLASEQWGLQADDRPPVEILVVDADEADIYRADSEKRDVPLAGIGLTLAALCVGAIVLAARRKA